MTVLVAAICGPKPGLEQQGRFTHIVIDSTRAKWGDSDQPVWLRYFGLDCADLNGNGLPDIVSAANQGLALQCAAKTAKAVLLP